jgi:AcrR family transcriptional regulator
MGVQERKAKHKAGLRQEILEAARDLFITEGYQNVSMRRIAEKIEYSPTTIYLYFKDKAELLDQLCEETFAKLVAEFEQVKQQASQNPIMCLREGLRAYVRFGLEFPNHYKVTFIMGRDPMHNKAEILRSDSMAMRAFGNLREAVGECIRQGLFPSAEVESASQALWATVHGITSLLIAHADFPFTDPETLIDLTIDRMIAGFRAG